MSGESPFRGLQIGGGGVRFTLFGFPVRVQTSFFIVVVILGLFPGATVSTVAIWTGVAAVSILWHELGHAFAARRLGSSPTIDLYSFGGLTHWQPAKEATRWNLISVALAGPVAGLLLGGAVAALAGAAGGFGTGNVRFLVIVILWINVGWGLVNLLPVLPLDGGHVLAELLPGERDRGGGGAAYVSIATGGVAAVVLISIGYFFGALVFGWAVMSNVAAIRAPAKAARMQELGAEIAEIFERLRRQDPTAVDDAKRVSVELSGPQQASYKLAAVEAAAMAGPSPAARRLLDELPGTVPPGMYALVVVSETYGQRGVDDLVEIFGRTPDRWHARWLTFALYEAGRLPEIVQYMHHVPAPSRGEATVEAAAGIADWVGNPGVAAQLRSLAVR